MLAALGGEHYFILVCWGANREGRNRKVSLLRGGVLGNPEVPQRGAKRRCEIPPGDPHFHKNIKTSKR